MIGFYYFIMSGIYLIFDPIDPCLVKKTKKMKQKETKPKMKRARMNKDLLFIIIVAALLLV